MDKGEELLRNIATCLKNMEGKTMDQIDDHDGNESPTSLAWTLHDIEKLMLEGKLFLVGDDWTPMKPIIKNKMIHLLSFVTLGLRVTHFRLALSRLLLMFQQI